MEPLQQFPIYRYQVREPSGPRTVITFLSLEDIKVAGGLRSQAIVGALTGPGQELVPSNFARNSVFVDFLHDVVRQAVPTIEEYVGAAEEQGSGWLNVHDARAWEIDREVAANDIIGSFQVEEGKLTSYVANLNHRILSEHGMFTPHPEIQEQLLSAMREVRFDPDCLD
jgi:hypothetical protein